MAPGGDTTAARSFAAYVATRSLVLLAALLWLTAVRAWRPLGLVFLLNAAVQIGDAGIGLARQQLAQSIGPVVFALLFLAAARSLGGLTWRLGRAGGPATPWGAPVA